MEEEVTPTTPEAIDRAVAEALANADELKAYIAKTKDARYRVAESAWHLVTIAAAYRTLLEAQSREWTAETIKDAPEGEYRMRLRRAVRVPVAVLGSCGIQKAVIGKVLRER